MCEREQRSEIREQARTAIPRTVRKVRWHGELVSGIGSLAEGDAIDSIGIQAVAGLPSTGDVWTHESDAAIRGFGAE